MAYKLAENAAFYPRVLIDSVLKPDLEALAKQGGVPDLRRRDFDGQLHLHILHPLLLKMGAALWKSTDAGYTDKAREEIERLLRS